MEFGLFGVKNGVTLSWGGLMGQPHLGQTDPAQKSQIVLESSHPIKGSWVI